MSPSYDAIVVGGGHNGLTCAAYLAKAGLRVCVLERRDILGGACVTEEVWPGHRVSRASYVVSMLQPKVVERPAPASDFGYKAIPLDPRLRDDRRPTASRLLLQRRGRTRESLRRTPERDAAAYPQFEELLERMADFLRPLMLRPPPALGSQAPRRPAVAAARGGPRRRAEPARRAGALPRDDDVGGRPARRVVRVRRDQGLDRLDGRGRRVGRPAHAGHRLQPAPPRARGAGRRERPLGSREGRHGRHLAGDRAQRRGVRAPRPHRRRGALDRRERRGGQRA